MISVLSKPSFGTSPEEFQDGASDVYLTCISKGSTSQIIEKNGVVFKGGYGVRVVPYEDQTSIVFSHFDNAKHAGTYSCRGKNNQQESETVTKVVAGSGKFMRRPKHYAEPELLKDIK